MSSTLVTQPRRSFEEEAASTSSGGGEEDGGPVAAQDALVAGFLRDVAEQSDPV